MIIWPSWKTHLEIGERLNNYLKFKKEDLSIFLLGTLLPDINNGYVVSDISKIIPHNITHLGDFVEEYYLDFYQKYESEINSRNPIFLGYFVHLFTDYMFNNDFYKRFNSNEINNTDLKKLKHNDFKIFNNSFINRTISITNTNNLLIECNKIDNVSIIESDIYKVINYLDNYSTIDGDFKLYTIYELNKLVEDTVTKCANILKLDNNDMQKNSILE